MNSSQMLITMAAMLLLSIVIVNVNRNALTNTENMEKAKYEIVAIALANTIIEEAGSKAFDEKTADNNIVTDVSQLSSNLGKDTGENNRKEFDDFDDYNGYKENTIGDSTLISADFQLSCKINYVDPFVSLDSVNYKTYHKRIEVDVTSRFLNENRDTVRLSKIISHYYFR